MKWLLPSIALALAPLAGSCASTPVYGDWVIADYCSTGGDDRAWARTGAPANAGAYRRAAAADSEGMDSIPEGAREYWFALPSGEVKLCQTNLRRAEGRRHWCNPQLAVWWSFRETETGPVIDRSQFPICLT